jgi:hypothetical protein
LGFNKKLHKKGKQVQKNVKNTGKGCMKNNPVLYVLKMTNDGFYVVR